MDMPDEVMIHIPDGIEQSITRVITLLRMARSLKHKLFVSGIFHLIFLDHG